MKTSAEQIPRIQTTASRLQVEFRAARLHACQGQKKSPLPFHLVDIRAYPLSGNDMDQVLRWMAAENQRSIEKRWGVLFHEFGPDEIRLGMEQERMIFFYLWRCLLGFVRVIELAENHWEIGSGISAPGFRRQFSGFNKLFNACSLLRISECAARENKGVARIMIVTYNEGVAHSLRNLLRASSGRYLVLKGHLFDFSRIREVTPEKEGKLAEIYALEPKLLAGEMVFLFDVSACVL
jgi:hypothetical protein